MSAGLPGMGLSGLFFLVSALFALPVEIVRTVRGRSSPERWATVFRHLALAVTMMIVLEMAYLALRLVLKLLSGSAQSGRAQHPGSIVVQMLPTTPLLITLGLILVLVCAGKLAQLIAVAARRRPKATRVRLAAGCTDASGRRQHREHERRRMPRAVEELHVHRSHASCR